MCRLRRFALPIVLVICAVARSVAAGEMHVAVLEFTNASKDAALESLGKGLQSMVTTDLANLATLKVVERERLKDVQGELKLSHSAGFDKTSAAKIGKLAGATHLFVGSYTVVGDQMRLDGRLLVVATGEVVVAEQIAGDKAYFFELEQKLVEKVIALLGVKPAPKEKAALSRPHTADFQAFQQFSDGLKAYDDGRLDEALKHLSEATAIDRDFKLASLTLEAYERLAQEVRAKAEAAGHVEDEVARLEKNKALSAELAVVRKLWPLVDAKGTSSAAKLQRVAAACALSVAYRDAFGFSRRGPVTSEDLAKAGFDSFTLNRTADALLARAWAEAPDVFPRIPPLCIGFGVVSSDSKLSVEKQLDYLIEAAAKLSADPDTLLSYISNNAVIDPAAEALHLDAPGEAKLWEKLYALAERLPRLPDRDRARYEETIAQHRRTIGDFDGSTQMYAAASRHTRDSYQLKELAREIDQNKQHKLAYEGARPLVHELYVIAGGSERAPKKLSDPAAQQRLVEDVERAREIPERSGYLIFGDLPVWRMLGSTWWTRVRTGPRSTRLHTDELRYSFEPDPHSGSKHPAEPVVFVTPVRAKRFTVKAQIDQSPPPPEWRPLAKAPLTGGGEVGVGFALSRVMPDAGIEHGVPEITIGYAVLVGTDRAHLVQITRDGEHVVDVKQLADAAVGSGRAGRRPVQVTVEPGSVAVSVDGKRVSFPWKPGGDADGFVGFVFHGPGYASVSNASLVVK
ncbi:MAG TPA: CsgG/HfaB family protein [Kofleriaceae bacterium]|jgi:TolB-like protein|nr:CsgG/HfaB family protein [Kofleriaceae bacterium]